MSHKNPWFLITSEEIAEIRRHLCILEDEGSQKCRDSASAIAEILIFVEGRLV
jgi:hypothetical protein